MLEKKNSSHCCLSTWNHTENRAAFPLQSFTDDCLSWSAGLQKEVSGSLQHGRISRTPYLAINMFVLIYLCICVCVCVQEKETREERYRQGISIFDNILYALLACVLIPAHSYGTSALTHLSVY